MSPAQPHEHPGQSDSRVLFAIVLIELAIGTIIILLRTYTKFCLTRETENWSYFWALLTWVIGLVTCATAAMSVSFGLGIRFSTIPPSQNRELVKWSVVSIGISRYGTAFARTAVTTFIYGIQGRSAAAWRKLLLWFIAISNIVLANFMVFIHFFQCNPPSDLWNKLVSARSCPLQQIYFPAAYVVLSYGVLTDLFLAFYPISIFFNLKVPAQTKITLSILFSFGVVACLCAAMTTWQLAVSTKNKGPSRVPIWTVTEIWAILIASSVPALYPLFRKSASRQKKSSRSRKHVARRRNRGALYGKPVSADKPALRIVVIEDFEVERIDRPKGDETELASIA